ncbi:MAG: hypothetical protein LBU71_01195 [Acinetobacter pittii]|nr:hypothetical protein [Acinetobacter pittii]
MRKLLVSSRSGRTGEGHLRVCWLNLSPVCQPSFVLPPYFQMNALAELPKSGVGYAHPSFFGTPCQKL